MKKAYLPLAILTTLVFLSCGSGKKDNDAKLNDLKTKLEKAKKEKAAADKSIHDLEDQIAKLDTAAANAAAIKLVAVNTIAVEDFTHYIDLQGKVDADNISYISPRMGPAQVKAVYVKEGQYVNKGQLLLKLDDAIIRQSIAAANKSLETIKTQLGFAKNIYQRQKNLWEQNIGTEVQVISAKTNVETLDNQLKGAEENIKVLNEQLKTSNVYSDVSGIADIVNIRVGETFSGMTATGPQIKIVNKSSLKVITNVPENYLSKLYKGIPVVISIPDANKDSIRSSISLISQSIDPTLRGFIAEARIASSADLKPNQTAIMRIADETKKNAVVVPVNVIQNDETSKYVYVLEKQSNGKSFARKKIVRVGSVYGEKALIEAGLTAGELLITEGYQSLYEGQLITTDVK